MCGEIDEKAPKFVKIRKQGFLGFVKKDVERIVPWIQTIRLDGVLKGVLQSVVLQRKACKRCGMFGCFGA